MKTYQSAKSEQKHLKETISKQTNFIDNLYVTYEKVCKFVQQ